MQNDVAKNSIAQTILNLLKTSDSSLSVTQIAKLITRPPESHLGDYALPCFVLAKATLQKPQELASELAVKLTNTENPWVEKTKAVGAFCNIFINTTYLATYLIPKTLDQTFFEQSSLAKKTRVMVEFSQPNTHKEFHIGHGRNVCLGDAICRLLLYTDNEVVGVNYIGDEGTHVAKCLWQIEESNEELPKENQAEWYGKKYAQASRKLEEASEEERKIYNSKISAILTQLEAKNGKYYDIWLKTRQDCLNDFNKTYTWLDIHFDHFFYESEVSEESQQIVDEYVSKGLFVESEGAIGIHMEQWNLGFFMARKSDGTTLYITKDLALARKKFNEFAIDKSIYVVGNEQNFHFRQLFKALELMGFPQATQCYHLSYAHVRLPHGKMSSRKGDAITFAELIRITLEELAGYLEKYRGIWEDAKIEQTAHRLAVGAIKYGMLSSDPSKDIVFDAKAWTSFEGNSGPYLMYVYSRTQSILKKCHDEGHQLNIVHLNLLTDATEHELLGYIYDFNQAVQNACEQYKPSILCNHLYNMCKAFNRFYAHASVLNAPSNELRSARMALVASLAQTLRQGLYLIGITPTDQM